MRDHNSYKLRRPLQPGLLLLFPLLLTGCAHSPSFNVLGSYFPGWIACMVFAVLLTTLLRVILNRLGWERRLPVLPLFYFSIALLIACTFWLVTFE
jgi:hypothetical protein